MIIQRPILFLSMKKLFVFWEILRTALFVIQISEYIDYKGETSRNLGPMELPCLLTITLLCAFLISMKLKNYS
jgi:hypothetical protein